MIKTADENFNNGGKQNKMAAEFNKAKRENDRRDYKVKSCGKMKKQQNQKFAKRKRRKDKQKKMRTDTKKSRKTESRRYL